MALRPSVNGHNQIAKLDPKGIVAGHEYGKLTQTSTTDTYTWRDDGASGQILLVLTITYTDSTKETIDHWQWSTP